MSKGTYTCHQCGAEVIRDAPFSHMHCSMCGDLYTDFKQHDAVPEVKRKHDLHNVVYGAIADRTGWVLDLIQQEVWTFGSKADLTKHQQAIGERLIGSITQHVGWYEEEQAIQRLLASVPPDVSLLTDRMTALREWLEADEPLNGGGWDHFGFRCKQPAVMRAAGGARTSLSLSVCPDPNRLWMRLSAEGDGKYIRSRRSGGLLAPVTDVERVALRSAIEAAGFEVADEWGAEAGVSYVLTGVKVGPNIAEGNKIGWKGVPKLKMPEGWA